MVTDIDVEVDREMYRHDCMFAFDTLRPINSYTERHNKHFLDTHRRRWFFARQATLSVL